MTRKIGWLPLLLFVAMLGCTRTALQHKSVPDPLLVTKPGVEGRPHAAQSNPSHRSEPTPPPPAE